MKFTINSRVLKSALESTAKAINPKPTIPSLADFLLEGDGLTLTITGSDASTTIKETLDCEAEGKALLPTNLLELVRTLPDDDVTVEADGNTATITWRNGHSTIPAFNPEEYPAIADYDGEYVTIEGDNLVSALAHTLPHTADDEMRPVMNGVLFKAKGDGTIDVVASDSHTLGLCTINCESEGAFEFVIPANALKFVSNLARITDVGLGADDKSIYFKAGSTTVITRQIVGKFPRYESVIPKTFASTLTAEKGVLLNSLKRVLVCSNKASGHIKLTLGMLGSTMEAEDLSMGVCARENPEDVTYDGADLVIGFKGEYLAKCIAAIESETVKINFTEARRAAVVTSDEDTSIMLIMPVQI